MNKAVVTTIGNVSDALRISAEIGSLDFILSRDITDGIVGFFQYALLLEYIDDAGEVKNQSIIGLKVVNDEGESLVNILSTSSIMFDTAMQCDQAYVRYGICLNDAKVKVYRKKSRTGTEYATVVPM